MYAVLRLFLEGKKELGFLRDFNQAPVFLTRKLETVRIHEKMYTAICLLMQECIG